MSRFQIGREPIDGIDVDVTRPASIRPAQDRRSPDLANLLRRRDFAHSDQRFNGGPITGWDEMTEPLGVKQ